MERELRIGNWYCEEDEKGNTIERQWTFTDFHHAFEALGGNVSDFYRLGFKPIPITQQWLERLGFQHDHKAFFCDWTLEAGEFEIEIEQENKTGEITRATVECCEIELKFVHQLQNLFFSLTGKELKPIEL